MSRSRLKTFWTLAGAAMALGAVAQAQDKYITTELTAGSGRESRAYAINKIGQVVGLVDTGDTLHASLWFNGAETDLHKTSHLDLQLIFTADHGEAFNISDAGQVVGTAWTVINCPDTDWTVTHGFLLRPATLSDLGTPFPGDALADFWTFGSPCFVYNSAATAVSNRNHVVGWAAADGGIIRAFLVTPKNGTWFVDTAPADQVNDNMINLGTFDGQGVESSATDVNDDGLVTGYTYLNPSDPTTTTAYHAFLVTPLDTDFDQIGDTWAADLDADGGNDLMSDLGTLGGNNSWGRGINNSNQVVGESDTADLNVHAFMWSNGSMIDLGTLGGDNSSAASIDDLGRVVGWAETANGDRHACLWVDNKPYDLNSLTLNKLSIVLTEARDINSSGEIVGWGVVKGDETNTPQAFSMRLASDAEIAAAEESETPTTTPTTDPNDSNSGGGSGNNPNNPLDLDPLFPGQPSTTPVDGNGFTTDPLPSTCGIGTGGLLPLALGIGFVALSRRRRWA
ncbi:MAG: DUF3466 family protein [Phycisphaerales bacterium]|nr:DUF3466 family protein [Phycisphaerales bacterium]